MADSSGGIIAAHKLFGEKGRVAPQFCIAGHYGNHCHLFYLYGQKTLLIAVAVAAGIMTESSVYGICASVWKYCKKEI